MILGAKVSVLADELMYESICHIYLSEGPN